MKYHLLFCVTLAFAFQVANCEPSERAAAKRADDANMVGDAAETANRADGYSAAAKISKGKDKKSVYKTNKKANRADADNMIVLASAGRRANVANMMEASAAARKKKNLKKANRADDASMMDTSGSASAAAKGKGKETDKRQNKRKYKRKDNGRSKAGRADMAE